MANKIHTTHRRSVSTSSATDSKSGSIYVDSGSDSKSENASVAQNPTSLERTVGLMSGISLIAGSMIGSGIFISPTGVASGAGSVGLSLVIWTLCGIIAIVGSLSYVELGLLIPQSGGEYPYLMAGFGDVIGYLFAWVSIFLLRPCSCAIIALTCANYVLGPFYDDGCNVPTIHVKFLTALIICVIGGINMYSVTAAEWLQSVTLVGKLAALVIIIFGGFVHMANGHTEHLASGFEGTSSSAGAIAIAIYNGMWAYDGWNNLNFVTEEIINPKRNIALSLLIAIPMVTVVYLLVNISYFTVMSVPELLDSPGVAVTWADSVIPNASWLIPLAVAVSTFGATNGAMFASGRLPYAAAKNGHQAELLSFINCKRLTPQPSLTITVIFSLLYVIPGDIGSLLDLFSFAIWMFYAATFLSLIVLRFTMKDAHREFKVPIVLPIFAFVVACFLVIAPLVDEPRMAYLYAFIFIVAGLVFYFPFVYFKKVLPGMNLVTTYGQLMMQCTPPTNFHPDQ